MKSKEEKIYTYIALFIGLLFWLLYFFLDDLHFHFTTDFRETRFRYFWRYFFSYKNSNGWTVHYEGLNYFFWVISQIFFLLSWWYTRDEIVKIIKKLHNKI
jgi:hypothetical protein